jgi:membrane fusion protein (multidrug efflux system)
MAEATLTAEDGARPGAPVLRRRLIGAAAAVLVGGALAYGLWWTLVASRHVSTDDAYVTADVAQITPLFAAAIKEVRVHDTEPVKKGQVLVVLDDADAKVEVAQAAAELSRAIRRVRGYSATDASLIAQKAARAADVVHARTQISQAEAAFEKAQIDLQRRQSVLARGAVSGDEVTTAENALVVARTNLDAAKAAVVQSVANEKAAVAQFAANHTLTEGAGVEDNPEVASYRSKLAQAQLDLDRTVIRAPIDGIIAKRQAQVGQRAAVGVALMSVVPIDELYVDANFKEEQLRGVRIGQSAVVTSDLYGGGVKYRGVVIGRGGGTGSAFAIIPAQNATGNWIKVVQRVPIRIRLRHEDIVDHPLLIGLSMNASVDTKSARSAER